LGSIISTPGGAPPQTQDPGVKPTPPEPIFEKLFREYLDRPQPIIVIEIDAPSHKRAQVKTEVTKHINQAESIMGKFNNPFNYPLDISTPGLFSITKCAGNKFLTETLSQTIKLEKISGETVIRIFGNPKVGYDDIITFVFCYYEPGYNGSKGPESLSYNKDYFISNKDFYIAPDPRSMWKDLEVEDFEGYISPHEDQSSIFLPNLNKIVVAASRRGRSHANTAKPRDDNFAFNCSSPTGWNVFAVADGAGSSKYSRKGSKIACETVTQKFLEGISIQDIQNDLRAKEEDLLSWKVDFDKSIASNTPAHTAFFREKFTYLDKIIYSSIYSAFSEILTESKRKAQELKLSNDKLPIREYHTTLLFMAFKKFSFGYFFVSFWIGDGGMALYNLNNTGKVIVLGAPDTGEYAGQTRFLTMLDEIKPELAKKRTYFSFADDFESIIMATDGITDAFFPSDNSVISEDCWRFFWNEILKKGDNENKGCSALFSNLTSPEEKSAALLEWLNFWSVGNHDDRTLLVVKSNS
jgi:serine/threonine protein phosphatase PrpC